MLLHFTAVMAGLNADALIRTCPSTQHLSFMFVHHSRFYAMMLHTFMIGIFLNMLQIAAVFVVLYGYIEAAAGLFLIISWLVFTFRMYNQQVAIRIELLAYKVSAGGRSSSSPAPKARCSANI